MIKKEIIDQIREQTDIVQIIGEYLPLKKSGKHFRTLCPFHTEKSPSFYVNQERQIYHCFGCGAGGSVITFLMQYEKLPFPDAIKKLAGKLGIIIETEATSYKYQALYDANEFAADFYTRNLEKSKAASAYLTHRKISIETIKRFRIGYATGGNLLLQNAKKQGLTEEVLIKAGLAVKKDDGYHDWFYNRITFPVFSISGKVIGFNARGLDENSQPKYINTLETPVFKKGENLFGLFQAKNYLYSKTPILVEGNFDLLSLVENGINNVIAPLGTALTPHQAQLIRRYANQLIIAFDGDSAGEAATLRTIETLLKTGIDPHIALLPTSFDPDKYIKTFGKDKFDLLINNNLDFVDFILKISNTQTVTEKKLCLKQIINLVSLIEEKIGQELYINKISNIFHIAKENLLNQIQKTSTTSAKINQKADQIRTMPLSLLEEQVLSLIISNANYASIAQKDLPIKYFNANVHAVVQTAYDICNTENFTSAKLIDSLEQSELKKLVADLSFHLKIVPKENEFLRKLNEFKAAWLYQSMKAAQEKGANQLLRELTIEHYNIKKKLNQMRSKK
ncbi:MAG: DNA primase [Candidatus Latescibacteria bacterium]|nr:DNA primase [Candidatus Latescibacterota bacterium]